MPHPQEKPGCDWKTPSMAIQLYQGSRAIYSPTQACSEPTLVSRRLPSTFPCKQGAQRLENPDSRPTLSGLSERRLGSDPVSRSVSGTAQARRCVTSTFPRHLNPLRSAGWFVRLQRRNPLSQGKLLMGNGARRPRREICWCSFANNISCGIHTWYSSCQISGPN